MEYWILLHLIPVLQSSQSGMSSWVGAVLLCGPELGVKFLLYSLNTKLSQHQMVYSLILKICIWVDANTHVSEGDNKEEE